MIILLDYLTTFYGIKNHEKSMPLSSIKNGNTISDVLDNWWIKKVLVKYFIKVFKFVKFYYNKKTHKLIEVYNFQASCDVCLRNK